MPQWVIVGETSDGEPQVLVGWILELVWRPIAYVKAGHDEAAPFCDRWAAKRVLRRRNLWRSARCIRRERL